jgi:hypothetical protein
MIFSLISFNLRASAYICGSLSRFLPLRESPRRPPSAVNLPLWVANRYSLVKEQRLSIAFLSNHLALKKHLLFTHVLLFTGSHTTAQIEGGGPRRRFRQRSMSCNVMKCYLFGIFRVINNLLAFHGLDGREFPVARLLPNEIRLLASHSRAPAIQLYSFLFSLHSFP